MRTSTAKLKAASQEERIQKWKEHFKNLLGNTTHRSLINLSEKLLIANYTSNLDTLRRKRKHNAVLTNIKSRKAEPFDEISTEVWNTRKFHDFIIIMSCRHSSLSFIASGRSSGLYPVSSQSCCIYVRAGRPAFAQPYVRVHRSTSLMSSSLLQQRANCLYWIGILDII